MIADHLSVPLDTTILGIRVTVEKFDLSIRDDIVAVCRRGTEQQALSILDLQPPSRVPSGWEWIEAYRLWARHWR